MTDLYAPVVSIFLTKRRRFAWAAWWTGAPVREPFRQPDAHGGGARSPDEARAEAEAVAGAGLRIIESSWARAWSRILVGAAPWPARAAAPAAKKPPESSIWTTLGVDAKVTPAELKRAFRTRSLETHPDRGGTNEAFRAVVDAYAEARKRVARPRRQGIR